MRGDPVNVRCACCPHAACAPSRVRILYSGAREELGPRPGVWDRGTVLRPPPPTTTLHFRSRASGLRGDSGRWCRGNAAQRLEPHGRPDCRRCGTLGHLGKQAQLRTQPGDAAPCRGGARQPGASRTEAGPAAPWAQQTICQPPLWAPISNAPFFLSNNFMMPHRAVSKVLTPLQTSESDSSVSSRASCLPVDEPTAAGQQGSCSVWGRPLHFPTRCSPDKLLHFCPLSFTHFLQPIWLNSIWIRTDFYPVANITLLPLTFIDASQWIYLNTSVYTPGNWIYTYRLRLSINQTEEIFYEKQRTRYWWNEGQNDLLSLN